MWALQTIYKTLTEIRTIADRSYPEHRKAEAFGSWREEAGAKSAAELFEIFCKKRKCLATIASGFGAVGTVHKTETNRAQVETMRGQRFEMAKYDGKFGLATFQEELLAAKLRFIDSLKQVKQNARAFEEQRAASGRAE